MIGPDSETSQWQLRDNLGVFLVDRSPLAAKFKNMTQHSDISNECMYLSLCLTRSSFVSVSAALVSCTPSGFQICFYTVLQHCHLKASDFYKTIKKENRFYLVSHVYL